MKKNDYSFRIGLDKKAVFAYNIIRKTNCIRNWWYVTAGSHRKKQGAATG